MFKCCHISLPYVYTTLLYFCVFFTSSNYYDKNVRYCCQTRYDSLLVLFTFSTHYVFDYYKYTVKAFKCHNTYYHTRYDSIILM